MNHFLLITHLIYTFRRTFSIFVINPDLNLPLLVKANHPGIRHKAAKLFIKNFKPFEDPIKDSEKIPKLEVDKLLQIKSNKLYINHNLNILVIILN